MFMIQRNGKEIAVSAGESGALADKGGLTYAATFDGKDVIMTDNNGNRFPARWKLDGSEVRDIPGSGVLQRFRFTFFDYGSGNQRLHSLWSFNGSSADAVDALKQAGYFPARWDNRFNRSSEGAPNIPLFHMRSRGGFLTGADSGHAILHLDGNRESTQTRGELHVGEHNPVHPIGFFLHQREY